jgi:hypothetical protein
MVHKVERHSSTACRDFAAGSNERSHFLTDRIDAFAKHLGAQDDRRGLLRAAAAGTLGLLGLSVRQDDAAAGNRNCETNKDCGKNQRCVKKGTKDKKCGKNDRCKCKKK